MGALEIISLSYADDTQLYLQSDNLTSVKKLSFIDDINWRMSRNILELTETTQKYVLFVQKVKDWQFFLIYDSCLWNTGIESEALGFFGWGSQFWKKFYGYQKCFCQKSRKIHILNWL